MEQTQDRELSPSLANTKEPITKRLPETNSQPAAKGETQKPRRGIEPNPISLVAFEEPNDTDSRSKSTPPPAMDSKPTADEASAGPSTNSSSTSESDPPPDGTKTGRPSEQIPQPAPLPLPQGEALTLDHVRASLLSTFPLVAAANASRDIAAGEAIASHGPYDLRLKATSEAGPLGFYQTYRQQAGVEQELFNGSTLFAGYRLGRGNYQPWYLERQTNEGGEFKVGFLKPLAQNRPIDPNRAEFFRAHLEQDRVEPEIQAQILLFIRDASVAYWEWLAAGRNLAIAEDILELARLRNQALVKEVRGGNRPQIELVDNERLIVSREAKVIDSQRKLNQLAIKLSVFFRDAAGTPLIPQRDSLPNDFPEVDASMVSAQSEESIIAMAQSRRPELAAIEIVRQQTLVDLRQAENLTRPNVDLAVAGSQDVGEPTSSKRDKSQFELDAALSFYVPMERRKALGKIRSIQGKLTQIDAKREFTANKVGIEVNAARTAILAEAEVVKKATKSLELARTMEKAEQRKFELGDSNLLNVNLREEATANAAVVRNEALFAYFVAFADYVAANGLYSEAELIAEASVPVDNPR
jgi:outer membrane protein TolC